MATSTVEDYVKAIYLAQHEGAAAGAGKGRAAPGSVSVGELAAQLRVVPGTATAMMKALSEAGLVKYEPRRGVRLTAGGEKLALHVLRRHRLIELFLVRYLKLDWSEVHEEAEALEHAISEKVVERLDELLGRPEVDPHGDPIPSGAGKVSTARARPLSACETGDEARVVRVDNRDAAFLKYAEKNGLVPGAVVKLRHHETAAEAVTVSVRGHAVTLGYAAAGRIWVSV
jgi:DtxR family Mn-dependent transcriptional regulator